jgi:hypothetical protein
VRLYFSEARAINAKLAGLSTGSSGPVVATDTVVVGIGKLQAQMGDVAGALAAILGA